MLIGRRDVLEIHEKIQDIDFVHYVTQKYVYASYRNKIMRRSHQGQEFEQVATLPLRSSVDSLLIKHKVSRRAFRKRIENIVVLPSDTIVAIMDGRIFRIGQDSFPKQVFDMGRCRGTLHRGIAMDKRGILYLGEYYRNPERGSIRILRGTNDGNEWSWYYSSPPNSFRHYHGCFYDPWEDRIWFTTGDRDGENYLARSNPEFTDVQYLGDGSKDYSAVNLLITEDFVYFTNDNLQGPNYIRRLDKRTLRCETLKAINGPAWYGYRTSDDWMLFASTVEYSKTTIDSRGHLYVSRNGRDWFDVFTWKKDRWRPWSVFQFGVINFPGGTPTASSSLWLSGQAFSDCDLSLWRVSLTGIPSRQTANILYHHRTRASGADGNHIWQVVKALRALGHPVDIVSPPGVSLSEKREKTSKPLFARLTKYFRLKLPPGLFEILELLYGVVDYWKLGKALDAKKYDLIYERYAIFGWAGSRQSKKKGVPLILEVSFTSKTPVYPLRRRWLGALAERMDTQLFQDVDGIAVVTQVLKRHLVQEFGVNPDKIIVTPNAVDPNEFQPRISGRRVWGELGLNGKKVVGFVGGFYPWHGLDMFIDVAIEILSTRKDVVFLVIGDGPPRECLERKAARAGVERSIIFTGHISHNQIPQYMANFDMGVMPDSNDYGSPMKILEYMGMAKPVVAPRLSPIEEIMTDREEGFLFERGNREALVQTILRLLNDEGLRTQLGARGRERALRCHTWEKTASAVVDLYQKIRQ